MVERDRTGERGPAALATLPASRARMIGCVLSGAILAAPFLALLYAPAAGLAIMAVALGMLAFLATDAVGRADPAMRGRLRLAARLNLLLATACLIAAMFWV